MRVTASGAAYAWRELVRRAGAHPADVPLHYGPIAAAPARARVVVVPALEGTWHALATARPREWPVGPGGVWWPPGCDSLDVRLPRWITPGESLVARPIEMQTGRLVIHDDIIGATLFQLTHWETNILEDRDVHGRFPAAASSALRQGYLRTPVVDWLGLVLREWFRRLNLSRALSGRAGRLRLEHDIDWTRPFASGRLAVRAAGSALRRRRPVLAARHFIDGVRERYQPDRTSTARAIPALGAVSVRAGLRSRFFFMASQGGRFDSGYDLAEPWVRRLIAGLIAEGHAVGFHPGYDTADDGVRWRQEYERFKAILGWPPAAVRQHYGRGDLTSIWKRLESVGVERDATAFYPEQPGFRCGTCQPFGAFDVAADRPLAVVEEPVVAMDGTLLTYLGLTTHDTERVLEDLARTCREVEGDFSLIWHNDMYTPERAQWWEMYTRLVPALAQRFSNSLSSEKGGGC